MRTIWIRTLVIAVVGIMLGGFTSCVFQNGDLVLNDMVCVNIEETQTDGSTRLEISGLALHSALAVERMDARRDGTDLLVTLSLVPAHEEISGSFRYAFDVPDGVTRVRFGDWRAQIWPRP